MCPNAQAWSGGQTRLKLVNQTRLTAAHLLEGESSEVLWTTSPYCGDAAITSSPGMDSLVWLHLVRKASLPRPMPFQPKHRSAILAVALQRVAKLKASESAAILRGGDKEDSMEKTRAEGYF